MRASGWFLALAVTLSACTPVEDTGDDVYGDYLADSYKYVAEADWSKAIEVSVDLMEFKFVPKSITFRAGQAYALKMINKGGGNHNFQAGGFFRAIAAKSILYPDGEGYEPRIEVIELGYQEANTLFFVAVTPGEFALKCNRPLHAKFGMVGSITIEPN